MGDDLSASPKGVQSFLLTRCGKGIFTISYIVLKNRYERNGNVSYLSPKMAIIEKFYDRGTFPAYNRTTFYQNRFTIREK